MTAAARRVLEMLPAAICACDTTGAITMYNRRAVELWGREPNGVGPPERFCGALHLYQPDGTPVPHPECPMAEVLRTGVALPGRELVIERPDGSRASALVQVAPLFDDQGRLTGAINCFLDITPLKHAEGALAQLASITDLDPHPVVEADSSGRLRYLNPAARHAFPGFEVASLSHPLLEGIVTGGAPSDGEPSQSVDRITVGDRVYKRRTCHFPRDGRILIYATDLTDYQRATGTLASSERRFRTLLGQAADAIFVFAEDGRFLDVNQRACKNLGYTREELLRLAVADVELNSRPSLSRDFWQRVAREGAVTAEGVHRRKDGSTFPVEVSIGVIEEDGREVMLVLARDITERRHLEEELRQSQRLEAVGRLAGGIAHEFNNLLTAILGSADLLLETCPPASPGREDAKEIRDAAVRAASLTQQLLAFSRLQAQASEPLALDAVVTDMARRLQQLIGKDIELRIVLSPEPGAVRAARRGIEHVITNLAANARDAMPQGGVLTIRTANVLLDAEAATEGHPGVKPGPYVALSVGDTGVGMDAGVRAHLFDPFFTTKELGRGTGLGLATVYGIVAQSGGHVTVESQLGRGTTFTILLPRVESAEVRPVLDGQ